jgi:tRNA dimethylallyltransferase
MPTDLKFKFENSKLPILVGPTGVGKSEVAFHLAKRLQSEILSADAFQVYKGLEVGTAQPPPAWQSEVKHHLVGTRDCSQRWTAADFAKEALAVLRAAEGKHKRMLIAGGAGFYLKALVDGIPPGSAASEEVRSWILTEVQRLGPQKAHEWLAQRDPARALILPPADFRRVCRALEKTFASPEPAPFLDALGSDNVLFIGLERSRDHLDVLLRQRTEAMWKRGLLAETEGLLKQKIPHDFPVWGAIGYMEALAFLRGEMSAETAQERIFRRTRQYAKRQWTWFRRQHPVQWVDLDHFPHITAVVDHLMEKFFD